MNTDQIFKTKIEKSTDFKFDADVVNVFDDMVVRSVPLYYEFQRMITEIVRTHVQPGTSVYDLGCSTGTTFLSLNPVLDESIRSVGVDESQEMLDTCHSNLISNQVTRPFELLKTDLNKHVEIRNASVVILCLTLQFIRPINRLKLLQSIQSQIYENGCIILLEKVLGESAEFNREFINYYYDLKRRNNYEEMEISQKREALENVLVPYKLSENTSLLLDAGFHNAEIFFKWYNFTGLVALK